MNKDELLFTLQNLLATEQNQSTYFEAVKLLLTFIDDKDVSCVFSKFKCWDL